MVQNGSSSTTYFSGAIVIATTRTIEFVSSNHTGDLVNGQFGRPAHGMGFGPGVQIVEDPIGSS